VTSLRSMTLGGALGVLLLCGCSQTFDATELGVPATLASPVGETPTGQAFKVTTHTVHAFWGMLPLKKASLERALGGQLVGAKEVAQVRIRTRSRWSDLLFTALTLGIIAPKTVTYEGVVVGR